MARVGEQARQLLHRRRRVEQRAEAGRERGHRAPFSSAADRDGRIRCHSASRARRARSATFAAWTAHPPARGSAAASLRSRCSRSTPASAWCGSTRSRFRAAVPACCATPTPTACRRRGVEPARPPGRRVRGCGRVAPRPPRARVARRTRRGRDRPGPAPSCRRTVAALRRGRPSVVPEAPVGAASRAEPTTWSPHDRPGPELEHVLDARTPLLARAFEAARPTDDDWSRRRRRRRGSGGRGDRCGAGAVRRARVRGRRGRGRSASR